MDMEKHWTARVMGGRWWWVPRWLYMRVKWFRYEKVVPLIITFKAKE